MRIPDGRNSASSIEDLPATTRIQVFRGLLSLRLGDFALPLLGSLEAQAECVQAHVVELILQQRVDKTVARNLRLAGERRRDNGHGEVCGCKHARYGKAERCPRIEQR